MAKRRVKFELSISGSAKPIVAIDIKGERKILFIDRFTKKVGSKYFRTVELDRGSNYAILWGIVGNDEAGIKVHWYDGDTKLIQIDDKIDATTDRPYPGGKFTRSNWNILSVPS